MVRGTPRTTTNFFLAHRVKTAMPTHMTQVRSMLPARLRMRWRWGIGSMAFGAEAGEALGIVGVHISCVVGRIDVEPIATDGELLQRQGQSLRTYGTKWMGRNVDLGSIIMGVDAAVEEDHS